MTKSEAKKYVYKCTADILDNGSENEWLLDGGNFSDADVERVFQAFKALIAELLRRAGN
jgi:hypothetical protein